MRSSSFPCGCVGRWLVKTDFIALFSQFDRVSLSSGTEFGKMLKTWDTIGVTHLCQLQPIWTEIFIHLSPATLNLLSGRVNTDNHRLVTQYARQNITDWSPNMLCRQSQTGSLLYLIYIMKMSLGNLNVEM